MLTRDQFVVEFPEFEDVDPELVTRRLERAARMMSLDFFGEYFDDAQGFYAAHLLVTLPPLASSARVSGAVEVAAGSARVRFSEASASSSGASSGYWANYLALVRMLGAGPYVANDLVF